MRMPGNGGTSVGHSHHWGNIVLQSVESQRFAAFMRTFKNRTDRSYEALAKRVGVSSSSLHRYCAGSKIPADFGTAQRFARECGASPPELRELHRLWTLADANRNIQPRPQVLVADPQRTPTFVLACAATLAVVAGGFGWLIRSGKQRQ